MRGLRFELNAGQLRVCYDHDLDVAKAGYAFRIACLALFTSADSECSSSDSTTEASHVVL